MTPDAELLRQYAELNSEEAFAELVRRHLDLVYSTALRQVNGDAHLAQDIAQTVFTDLARKAAKLTSHPALTGWLYTSAYFAGCKAARTEHRRRAREQEALTMHELLQSTPGADWERVRPALDDAMHELKERERTAILMRYFENRAFAEIGAQLGSSEDAARKRVDRALVQLQGILSKRGITIGAALATAISANAIQNSPIGLATTLTSASLSNAATTGNLSALAKLMAATKIQTAIVSAIVLASVLMPFAIQQRAQARLREQDEALQQQSNQLASITSENQRLAQQLAQAQRPASSSDAQLQELLKLRSEAGKLRHAVEELKQPTDAKPLSPEEKLAAMKQRYAFQASRLKQWIAEHPSEWIPELANASDSRWIDAVTSLEKNDNFERAASSLRDNAESGTLSKLSRAFRDYLKANPGDTPSNVSQLAPYLKSPLDDSILQRYIILPASSVPEKYRPSGDWVLTQAAPVNPEIDTRFFQGLTEGRGAQRDLSNRWNLSR